MAGLREAPDQHVLARLEEHDPRSDPATLQRATHRGERDRRVARPHVDDDRDPREPLPIRRHEVGELGQQLGGRLSTTV